jgi:hypothetical protein
VGLRRAHLQLLHRVVGERVGLGDGGGLHAGELQVLAADPLPPAAGGLHQDSRDAQLGQRGVPLRPLRVSLLRDAGHVRGEAVEPERHAGERHQHGGDRDGDGGGGDALGRRLSPALASFFY